MLNDRHYDIIIITETWLNNSITTAMLNPLNVYSVYRLMVVVMVLLSMLILIIIRYA